MAVAKSENKLLFIDFYTDWCGPCVIMSEEVFTRSEVGDIYNPNFVSLKIDDEKGEGIELARKFEVRSFPAYIFVDPATGEMIHRSGSNKPKDDFLEDARGALDPKRNSVYLESRYESGSYDNDFLIDYALYKFTSGDRNEGLKLFDSLISRGTSLKDKAVWKLFCRCVKDYDNPQVRELSDNYQAYIDLYGSDAVDGKLREVTIYAPAEFTAGLCEFEGKRQNMALSEFSALCRDKEYERAAELVDRILADTTFDTQRTINSIRFYAIVSPRRTNDSVPFEWIVKQVGLLRFIAYNIEPRNNAEAHYDYACGLEYLINRSVAEHRDIPPFGVPASGEKQYDIISVKLKPKPVK
jgi:thiol-disulfide isomerase/thioredoxin